MANTIPFILPHPHSADCASRAFGSQYLPTLTERPPAPVFQTQSRLEPYPRPSPTTQNILPAHPALQAQRERDRLELIEDLKQSRSELKAYRRRR
jgi:hypothetical protein